MNKLEKFFDFLCEPDPKDVERLKKLLEPVLKEAKELEEKLNESQNTSKKTE